MKTWMMELPAFESFKKPTLTIDLETEKVKGAFRWASGEKNSRRWKPFMVGLSFCCDNRIEILVAYSFDESELIDWICEELPIYGSNTGDKIFMNSRNKFDEMVLKGRFINARRKLAELPGNWPCDPFEGFEFLNCGSSDLKLSRNEGIDWWDYPALARAEDRRIIEHCARDVFENLLAVGEIKSINKTQKKFFENPSEFLKVL